ncbi:hypothetical protein TNCV_536281 [Trichonephila clavipes]|nr:hypothetical protein TNCV_536281 [Trichonephila clavipes]
MSSPLCLLLPASQNASTQQTIRKFNSSTQDNPKNSGIILLRSIGDGGSLSRERDEAPIATEVLGPGGLCFKTSLQMTFESMHSVQSTARRMSLLNLKNAHLEY